MSACMWIALVAGGGESLASPPQSDADLDVPTMEEVSLGHACVGEEDRPDPDPRLSMTIGLTHDEAIPTLDIEVADPDVQGEIQVTLVTSAGRCEWVTPLQGVGRITPDALIAGCGLEADTVPARGTYLRATATGVGPNSRLHGVMLASWCDDEQGGRWLLPDEHQPIRYCPRTQDRIEEDAT